MSGPSDPAFPTGQASAPETATSPDPAVVPGAATPPSGPATAPEAPEPPDAATIGPTPPGPVARTGWRPPGPGDGVTAGRGCAVVAIVVAVLMFGSLAGVFGLVFLGGQIQSLLKGTIEFGTGGSGCAVTGRATSFPSSTAIHFVAWPERDVVPGETIVVRATLPDGTTHSTSTSYPTTGDCITDDLPSGLPIGHYALEFGAGQETLAHGEFEITP